jgi:hypothetical protein
LLLFVLITELYKINRERYEYLWHQAEYVTLSSFLFAKPLKVCIVKWQGNPIGDISKCNKTAANFSLIAQVSISDSFCTLLISVIVILQLSEEQKNDNF